MKNSKKILVIYHDPDFSKKILERLGGDETDIILANSLSEGGNILKKEKVDFIIIECPINSISSLLPLFLSRSILKQAPVLLMAKEKRFLNDFSGENILKFGFDEIDIGVQKLLEK